MKEIARSFKFILFVPVLCLLIISCKKEDNDDIPPETLEDLIIGSWQITDGDYSGTISFEESYNAKDYFFADTLAGSADFSWQLTDENLTMTIGNVTGDYEEYNEMGTGHILNSTISITNDQLSFDYDGEIYVYTRIPAENIIDDNDLLGTWQMTEGNYRDLVSFELSDYAYDRGVSSFIAETDSGAANFLWDVNGDMILIDYSDRIFGDYESYNEISYEDAIVMNATVTDEQLTFTIDGTDYIYSRVPEENALYRSDLTETIWQITSGDYSEVLSFNFYDDLYNDNGAHSFFDDGATGSTNDFQWTVCGDLITIEYRSLMMGDYTAQTGITQNTTATYTISLSGNELTISSNGDDYVYTPLPDGDIVDESDLIGEWQYSDAGGYTGTIVFNEGLSTDTFTDGAQSGSAEFSWYLNGNMISFYYDGNMTGDYETYNGISQYDSFVMLISVSGNELTIEYEGESFVYTKIP